MNVWRWIALSLAWAAGMATIVASSLEEESDPPPPPVPVTVEFELTSNDLARDLGEREAELSSLVLKGIYTGANQGQTLTLDRNSIALNNDSRFTINVMESGDDLLAGESLIEIAAELDVGLNHNPVAGQFSSVFDGTTTLVTVATNGVNVLVGDADTADFYSWSVFEAAEDDEGVTSLDLRMASAAYNMFDVVLRTALLTEDIIDDIETNKSDLEGVNTGSALALTCDNGATSGVDHTLIWTADPGADGTIGDNDAFEAEYGNCEDTSRGYFLDGTVLLTNYNPADTVILSTLGINVDLSLLYISETADPTTPGATTPRYNGGLSLRYQELAITQ